MLVQIKNIAFYAFAYLICGITTAKENPGPAFKENLGQVSDQNFTSRPDVLYYGNAGNMNFYLKNSGISYQLYKVNSWKELDALKTKNPQSKTTKVPDQVSIYRLDVNWLNINPNASIEKGITLPGYDNYYLAVCPNGLNDVKTYSDIIYKNIYSGIDIHYYDKNGQLEYDYIVTAGADYHQIQTEIKGAENILLNKNGDLIIKTPLGEIIEQAPLVKQNGKILISEWIVKNNIVSFNIKSVDPSLPFIIDPTIVVRDWGTYYGGPANETSTSCSTDNLGNVILFGQTESQINIATSGSQQITIGSSTWADTYVVKFNSSGVRQWGTYYGGENYEQPGGSATDLSGNIYFTGSTSSTIAIASPGSFQQTSNWAPDAFLVKLNASGIRQWGTYYGGNGYDGGYSCSTDASGNIFLIGNTTSTSSIASPGAHQTAFGGGASWQQDAFLAKFNSSGIRLWATYYGGLSDDQAFSSSTDPLGNIYFSGYTSLNTGTQIATAGSHQSIMGGGGQDAFLAKFNSNGVRQWGTYYGGSDYEAGWACTTDKNSNVYLGGQSGNNTGTVIATPLSYQPIHGGGSSNGFLAKFNTNGVRQWGTYYGGMTQNDIEGCTADTIGNIYFSGIAYSNQNTASTNSWTIIATPNSHQPIGGDTLYNGDAYIVKFNSSGIRQWGTYYGGLKTEIPGSGPPCSADKFGNVYLSGVTQSDTVNVISSMGSQQVVYGGGGYDAFLAKFYDCVSSGQGCVGIHELSQESIFLNVYPNPSNGDVTILSDKEIILNIVTELGQVILKCNLNSANNYSYKINNLNTGMYFITSPEHSFSKKIVVLK